MSFNYNNEYSVQNSLTYTQPTSIESQPGFIRKEPNKLRRSIERVKVNMNAHHNHAPEESKRGSEEHQTQEQRDLKPSATFNEPAPAPVGMIGGRPGVIRP